MMPSDPQSPEMRRRRFRPIPIRMLVPNFITLLAICAGLTAIRLSTEGRMELAVAAIVFAAVVLGLPGPLALPVQRPAEFRGGNAHPPDFIQFCLFPRLYAP